MLIVVFPLSLSVVSSSSLVYCNYAASSNNTNEENTKEDEDGDRISNLLRSGEWQLTTSSARQPTTERIDAVLVIMNKDEYYTTFMSIIFLQTNLNFV